MAHRVFCITVATKRCVPLARPKDESGGRVDRLLGQLGAQQCPGGKWCETSLFLAVMSELSKKYAYANL